METDQTTGQGSDEQAQTPAPQQTPPGPQEAITEPAKLLRIATMVRELLEETRQATIDEAGRARLRARGFELEARDDGGYRAGERALVGVRPERLLLEEEAPAGRGLPGVVDDEIYLGDRTDWRVRLGEELLTVAEAAASARTRARGDAVSVVIPPEAVLRLEERAP